MDFQIDPISGFVAAAALGFTIWQNFNTRKEINSLTLVVDKLDKANDHAKEQVRLNKMQIAREIEPDFQEWSFNYDEEKFFLSATNRGKMACSITISFNAPDQNCSLTEAIYYNVEQGKKIYFTGNRKIYQPLLFSLKISYFDLYENIYLLELLYKDNLLAFEPILIAYK